MFLSNVQTRQKKCTFSWHPKNFSHLCDFKQAKSRGVCARENIPSSVKRLMSCKITLLLVGIQFLSFPPQKTCYHWKILFRVLHEMSGFKDQNNVVFVNFYDRQL